MICFAENKRMHPVSAALFSYPATEDVRRLHRMLSAYRETPLVRLPQEPGVRAVYVKDEACRFGLKAFKGLGGIYAMYRMLCREFHLDPDEADLELLLSEKYREQIRRMEFATTTDGNHGKGVSWAAGILGCKAHVYLPKGSAAVRAQAIREAGCAEVTVTDMRYDDCVAWTRELAAEKGWRLIQDTSWPGYEEVPLWIMRGYTTLFYEALSQMEEPPTHIFLQAGVGAMAGAVAAAAAAGAGKPPVTVTAEPTEAACFFESFKADDGRPHPAGGTGQTIMAGLNCAVPCPLAWDILSGCAAGGFACGDGVTCHGMRLLGKAGITAGESGAVTAGLLDLLLRRPEYAGLREKLRLDGRSVILLVNTEGDTDPENYRRIVADPRG